MHYCIITTTQYSILKTQKYIDNDGLTYWLLYLINFHSSIENNSMRTDSLQLTTSNNVKHNDREARDILDMMEVDIIEPSKRDEKMVNAMDAFASYVLYDEMEACKTILDQHMAIGVTVGALQGGNDENEIYRVVINDDENGACGELISKFRTSREGKKFSHLLTAAKFEEYMLGMCDRRSSGRSSRRCTRVNNLMYILTFGCTNGQVRHIDKMNPNLQICLYMSNNCPSTIVFHLEEPAILNGEQLVSYWEETGRPVPDLIKSMLQLREHTSKKLSEQRHTRFFSFWGTIDSILETFGKLYRPVSNSLQFNADPGVTLIAGGNEVHAGPKTTGPRMFAFAVGIPEEDDDDNSTTSDKNRVDNDDEENDGEIQYCPSLLHVDLMCILFITMEVEFTDRIEEHEEAKRFLLELLISLIEDQPQETYERLLPDDRSNLRDWLGCVARATVRGDTHEVDGYLTAAIQSDTIFYSPDMGGRSGSSSNNKMNKRRAKRKNKKKVAT
ncbi:MAG: hypothetical protein ACI8RD_011472 [Bacillariaceae sp.]|jgi:hypothetical protein